jgi:hypothetical protein
MIQASTGPLRSIAGSTSSPTLASIAASDHGAFPHAIRDAGDFP